MFNPGTTPTHIFCVPDIYSTLEYEDISIVYEQKGKTVLVKRKRSIQQKKGAFAVNLSSKDTLRFSEGRADIQITARTVDGQVIETEPFSVEVGKLLKGGVI